MTLGPNAAAITRSRRWALLALATTTAALSVLAGTLQAPRAAPAPPGPQELAFEFTGGVQEWVVPDNVNKATFDLYGAEGGAAYGAGGQPGGQGAHLRATLAVVPGERLEVRVGGKGGSGGSEAGGFNGGGGTTRASFAVPISGGGGGATDVRRGPAYGLAERLAVAGGGGGGGGAGGEAGMPEVVNAVGGVAGASAADGFAGANLGVLGGGGGGFAGTSTAGGDGGNAGLGSSPSQAGRNGVDGTLGQGGAPGFFNGTAGDGGGGGGGFYGGGGGGGGAVSATQGAGGGGGGGGSSLALTGTDVSIDEGVRTGNGRVVISFAPQPAAGAQTGGVSDVTAAAARLSGSVDTHGLATSYYFEYGTTTSYGSRTPVVQAGSQGAAVPVAEAVAGLASSTTYHYRLVATNASGTGAGGDGTFQTAAETVPPTLDKLRLSRKRFRVGRRATPLTGQAAAVARGTTISYKLSEAARVSILVHRLRRQRYRRVAELTRQSKAGANRVRFTGRLGKRALPPGRYRFTLQATDAAGNKSAPRRIFGTIVRGKKGKR